jgi:NitT/TauT family transport system permease protein
MKRWMLYLLLALVVIAVWQYFGSANQTVRLFVSSPSLVIGYFTANYADLLVATRTTLIEAVAGLLIATIFSFGVMIICFYKPAVMDFVLPLMVTSQVIPLIVLAPFFIILLGIGMTSKIAMAAVISFFPIFVNFAHGYKSISSNIHELMHIYDAPTSFKIRNVYFPLSAGSVLAGLKVSATLAVIGAIVAEFTGAENGLGKNLFVSALRLEPELMMTSLVLSSLVGGSLFLFVSFMERKLVAWK